MAIDTYHYEVYVVQSVFISSAIKSFRYLLSKLLEFIFFVLLFFLFLFSLEDYSLVECETAIFWDRELF